MKTASRAGPAAFLPFDAEIALPDPHRNATGFGPAVPHAIYTLWVAEYWHGRRRSRTVANQFSALIGD
jgi:hypothetical protein